MSITQIANLMNTNASMQPALNKFAALPWPTRRAVREQIQEDLQDGKVPSNCFVPLKEVENVLPMQIGGYSDFYTSLEHCQNVLQLRSILSNPAKYLSVLLA